MARDRRPARTGAFVDGSGRTVSLTLEWGPAEPRSYRGHHGRREWCSVSMASANRRRPRAGSHSDPKHVSDNRWVACSNHAPYLNTRLEVYPPAWGYSTCEIRAAGPEAFGVARRPR